MKFHSPDRWSRRRASRRSPVEGNYVLVTPIPASPENEAQLKKLDRRADEKSIIYITASKTFDGPAVYITLTGSNTPTPSKPTTKKTSESDEPKTTKATVKPVPTSSSVQPTSKSDDQKTTATPSRTTTSTSSTTEATSSDESTSTESSSVTSSPTDSASSATESPVSATSGATPSLSPPPASISGDPQSGNGGMSGGAKAGVAITVIALVGLLIGVLFWFRRKKQRRLNPRNETEMGSESKAGGAGIPGFFASAARSPISEKSAALSPPENKSPFFPSPAPSGPGVAAAVPMSNSRPATSGSNRPDNPFGNYAERTDQTGSALPTPGLPPLVTANTHTGTNSNLPNVMPMAAVGPHSGNSSMTSTSGPHAAGFANASSDATGATAGPAPFQRPTEQPAEMAGHMHPYGAMGAAGAVGTAVGMASAGGPDPNIPVHRVQMDFNPNMPDELPIRVGQTVRLLREYDDGWALCELMGPGPQNAQGVVPRTCLSDSPIPRRPDPPVQPIGLALAAAGSPPQSFTNNKSPPRPPRPDEPLERSVPSSLRTGSPQPRIVQPYPEVVVAPPPASPPRSVPPQSPPQASSTLGVSGSQSQLTFPQPPSSSHSNRAVSPVSITITSEDSRPTTPTNLSAPPPQIEVPTLPPLTLDLDLSDDGLLGSTSISFTEDPKPSQYVVTGDNQPPLPKTVASKSDEDQHTEEPQSATSDTNPLPPPPLFSSHPRSLSPGPGPMKQQPDISQPASSQISANASPQLPKASLNNTSKSTDVQ